MKVVIKGSAGESLTLSDQEKLIPANGSEHYLVSLNKQNFQVQQRVYAFDPANNGLAKFFGELAACWRGWNGPKVWNSLENEFSLTCDHDGLGHVTMDASLRD